jgi:acyl-CoA reductase-like NAD-dependent aldehyde dehydrogenase
MRFAIDHVLPGASQAPLPANLIDGEWRAGEGPRFPVRSPIDGETLAELNEAAERETGEAVEAARRAFTRLADWSPFERYRVLDAVSRAIEAEADQYTALIVAEAGKPIRDARVEVWRAAQTFRLAAEEAKRIHGEEVPVAATPGSEKRLAFTVRVPLGVVCAITPFNSPLNQMNHKVPTALAGGNAVVLKPPEVTPLSAVKLLRTMMDAGLPPGAVNMLQGQGERVGEWLLENPDINAYTFTGSAAVGRHIHEKAGLRKTLLELGSNSAVIVHRDADLALASRLVARAGNVYAGQICISVQRVYVHHSVYAEFVDRLREEVSRLKVGDPWDETTDIGPMISVEAAMRAESWLQDAVAEGARVLTGGSRDGNWFQPTLVDRVKPDMWLVCREVFAPIISLIPYTELAEAVAMVNDSEYGLQAGVFTQDVDVAFHLVRSLEVGGVIINDTSNYRVDQMPYGGTKNSGLGREGIRYAIEELTEPRLVVLNLRPERVQ